VTVQENLTEKVIQNLLQYAELLEKQSGSNPYRAMAFRRAAETLLHETRDLRHLAKRHEIGGLMSLPSIGPAIASFIEEILFTGSSSQLERLKWSQEPRQILQRIPGIGPRLCRRITETLQLHSLEDLQKAVKEDRIQSVSGVGKKTAKTIDFVLRNLYEPTSFSEDNSKKKREPSTSTLLSVDAEYREKAAQEKLRKIAPKRFNPYEIPWLPVLHTVRGDWQFTALFSNTPGAHELRKTNDWVVIYFYHTKNKSSRLNPQNESTIFTETRGALAGQRVVRGREKECENDHFRSKEAA
jgi:DNA polymerase (family X)